MNPRLDSEARAFRDELRQRANKKKKLALEAAKKLKPKVAKADKSAQALLAIRDALQSLAELIAAQGQGPVKFTVEERDLNGKVKSFRAE